MYEYICNITERNKQQLQIILFTITSVNGIKVTIEERDRIMKLLENAIINSIRNVDVSTRYSSTQYAVLLMNLNSKETDDVATRIMTEFYRTYDLLEVELHYDSAELSDLDEKDDK
jgi:GGDEF domain-containing protein